MLPRAGFLEGASTDLTLPLKLGHPASSTLGKEVNDKDISAKCATFEHDVSNRVSQLGEKNKTGPEVRFGRSGPLHSRDRHRRGHFFHSLSSCSEQPEPSTKLDSVPT